MNKELIQAIIYLLVGTSILLYGMKIMGAGLKSIAGKGLKSFFKKTQNNPIIGLGIGTIVTVLIQSSDATSAMIIGFINAGVMSMFQGLSIMLGAYIGTTVTGIFAAFSSLPISLYLLLFCFIGILLIYLGKDKVKNLGEILLGLGMLFFGLAVMKDAFKNEDITRGCQFVFSNFENGFILFLFGVLITALIQSSSAVTSIVIAMVGGGALTLNSGLYIVLGATLGTVATTLLSSLGGTINGKRVATTAFIMRAITSIIMVIILFIFEDSIVRFMHIFAVGDSDELPIAMFTVFYNIIFMPLLIPFLKPLNSLVCKLLKDKESDKIAKTIKYIDDKILITPSVAQMQVKKEIINMYDIALVNYKAAYSRLIGNKAEEDKFIVENEDKIDYLNKRIIDFLIKLSNKVLNEDEAVIGSFYHVVNDIERIGDHAYNFYEMALELDNKNLSFPEVVLDELNEMNLVIMQLFDITKEIFENNDNKELAELHSLEEKTDEDKRIYYSNHFNRIKTNAINNELTPYISSILTELERVADHLTNIGYSIKDPTGDEI